MGYPRIILRPTSMLRKKAGQMRKLLGMWDQKQPGEDPISKRKACPQPVMKAGEPEFLNSTIGVTRHHVTRRQIVLNRHFTEIISDVLANSLKKELDEMGVSITSIETKAWNKGVSVFYTTLKPFDEKTHEELNLLTSKLRYAISERQLIGRVPLVNFVHDRNAELNHNLSAALSKINLKEENPETSLLNPPSGEMRFSKSSNQTKKPALDSKRFSAPSDMSNTVLGLDYPSLYDEAAVKLIRGRAQSERMISNVALDSTTPVINIRIDDTAESEDPQSRIVRMQKFMVSQRKKKEYLSRKRRQEELIHRDEYKWDVIEDDNLHDTINSIDNKI